MLNELQEYNEYSFDTILNQENEELWRLKYRSLITNGFAGIERALVTVARKHMFSEEGTISKDAAYDAIKLWCGIESVVPDAGTKPLEKWLYKYIKNCHLMHRFKEYKNVEITDAAKKRLEPCIELANRIGGDISDVKLFEIADKLNVFFDDMSKEEKKKFKEISDSIISMTKCIDSIRKLDKKKQGYGHAMFSFDSGKKDDKGSNDLKTITFDEIIAKAYIKGSLKRYYLCCKDKYFFNHVSVGAKGKDKPISAKNENMHKDIILKTVSSFLLGQATDPLKSNYVFFNKTDAVNWLADLTLNKDYDKYLDYYKIDKKGSIVDEKKVGENALKISICTQLRDQFELQDEDHIKEWVHENPEGVYYMDMGANKYMEEIMCSNKPVYYKDIEGNKQ